MSTRKKESSKKKRRLAKQQDERRHKRRKLNTNGIKNDFGTRLNRKRNTNGRDVRRKKKSNKQCASSKLDKHFPEKGWHIVKKDGLFYNAVMTIKKKVRGKRVKRVYVMQLVKKDNADIYQVYTRYNQIDSHCKRQVSFLDGRYGKNTLDACVDKFVDHFYAKTLGTWDPLNLKYYVKRDDKWLWVPFPSQLSMKRLRRNMRTERCASFVKNTASDFIWDTEEDEAADSSSSPESSSSDGSDDSESDHKSESDSDSDGSDDDASEDSDLE